MKKRISVLFLFLTFHLTAQVTIVVDELPTETPKNVPIFISGNFEGWSGGKKEYQLEQKGASYMISLPNLSKTILFKFTQGSWKTVECAQDGTSIDNRSYKFNKANDTLRVKIAGWDHLASTGKNQQQLKM